MYMYIYVHMNMCIYIQINAYAYICIHTNVPVDQFQTALVVHKLNGAPFNSLTRVLGLLRLEDVPVELLLEPFIRVVNAKLFKQVNLRGKNIPMYIYIYIYTDIQIDMYVYVCIRMYVYIYTSPAAAARWRNLCRVLCKYTYIHIYTCMYTYVFTYWLNCCWSRSLA